MKRNVFAGIVVILSSATLISSIRAASYGEDAEIKGALKR